MCSKKVQVKKIPIKFLVKFFEYLKVVGIQTNKFLLDFQSIK